MADLMITSAMIAIITAVARMAVIKKEDNDLSIALLLLAATIILRSPKIFSSPQVAAFTALIAHILTLVNAAVIIKFCYKITSTPELLGKNTFFTVIYRYRIHFLFLACATLVISYLSGIPHHSSIEVDLNTTGTIYWLTFTSYFFLAAISILYLGKTLLHARHTSSTRICLVCICTAALLSIWYCISKIITICIARIPDALQINLININSGITVCCLTIMLCVAGAVPVLYRWRNHQ